MNLVRMHSNKERENPPPKTPYIPFFIMFTTNLQMQVE